MCVFSELGGRAKEEEASEQVAPGAGWSVSIEKRREGGADPGRRRGAQWSRGCLLAVG